MATQKPPGIKGRWLSGNLTDFNENTLDFLEQLAKLGDASFIQFGPFPGYFFNHPDYVREVLVKQNNIMHKPRVTKRALSDISGENLFSGDGEYWKQQRKLMQPAFHTQRIGAYADVMVDYATKMVNRWQDGEYRDMDTEMTGVTMNIVVKTLFDVDIEHDNNNENLGEAMAVMFRVTDNRMRRLFSLPHWIPTKENRGLAEAKKIVSERLNKIIQERRQTKDDRGDLLSMLIMAQDEATGLGMTDLQVYHEVVALFAAGHETTANTLTWALFLLSKNPQAVYKMKAEIGSVLGNRPASLADMKQLKYTEMVIKETLRLYPTAWAVSRETTEKTEIAGYEIPKNAPILVAPWTLHRDERWWDHPLEFRPERFSPENEAKIEKFAYFPFGGGPRICIGNAFAMMEAVLVLATIIQHVDLTLDPNQIVEPERVFTLRTKYGLNMRIKQHTLEAIPV